MKLLPEDRNIRVLAICAGSAAVMLGAAYAAVPLYNLFCAVTGYGGTTQVASAAPGVVLDRVMTIRFDASREAGFPWDFEPVQRSMRVQIGETAIAWYRATNRADRAVTAVATYNVTPFKAAFWFNKIECFCFVEQTLQPGESIDMPVLFFVDPAIAGNDRMNDVNTMTLSYTFFEAASQTATATGRRDAVR